MLFLRRVGATLGYHKKMGKAYPRPAGERPSPRSGSGAVSGFGLSSAALRAGQLRVCPLFAACKGKGGALNTTTPAAGLPRAGQGRYQRGVHGELLPAHGKPLATTSSRRSSTRSTSKKQACSGRASGPGWGQIRPAPRLTR